MVISAMNQELNQESKIIENLVKDILIIRERLWDIYGETGKNILNRRPGYTEKNPIRKKRSVQSYYCQTQESLWLHKLYKYLKARIEIEKQKNIKGLEEGGDRHIMYESEIKSKGDKLIGKDDEDRLHFIPFNCGAYVLYETDGSFFAHGENTNINIKIAKEYVDDFNKQNEIIQFETKPFETGIRFNRSKDTL
jgi:hypothetical protein